MVNPGHHYVLEADGTDAKFQDSSVVLKTCTAFEGHRRIATGALPYVAEQVKAVLAQGQHTSILIFDDATSKRIEVDFRGSLADVLGRLTPPEEIHAPDLATERKPGRPKLGVVAREVTLLPRHWQWLAAQPGGASVALRKLVETASRAGQPRDRARQSKEAVDRFMLIMAGDFPGFEEASRAFYRNDRERFDQLIESWPADVRDHLRMLVANATHDEAAAVVIV